MSDIEGTDSYKEVITWIKSNPSHFGDSKNPIYDPDNLKRIKRFANSPLEYLDERIELNKKVSENYHKIHTSILTAVASGFYGYLLTTAITNVVNTNDQSILQNNVMFIIILLASLVMAKLLKAQTIMFKLTGLLRVVRDSEIEIYYLTKIKENRKS